MDNSDIGTGLITLVIIIAIISWICHSCCNNAEEDQQSFTAEIEHEAELGESETVAKPRRRVPRWISRKRCNFDCFVQRHPKPNDSQAVHENLPTSPSRIFTIDGFTDFSRNGPTSHQHREELIYVHPAQSQIHATRHDFLFKTLVIATDATPQHIGGYLVNHFTKRVEYYSASTMDMPWVLQNRSRCGNPTEFEMKNLLCALLLWENVIVRYRKVAIFTDNSAIVGNSVYGLRVRDFIQHLKSCRKVQHVDHELIYVNSNETPDLFNEFIRPADQLSRLNESDFRSSIMAYHPEFREGDICHAKFILVRRKVLFWVRKPCHTCGFHISRTGSLKRTHY